MTNSARGRPAIVHRAAQAILGPVASPVARFDGAFGADWPTWAPGAACACLAHVERRVTGEQVCLRTTRWHAATSEGASHGLRGLLRSGRVAGSRGPEGDDGAPIPVRRLRLNLRNWDAVANANGQAFAEWATRGDERRNTAAHGHDISLGAFRTARVLGVDKAGLVSWRSRARRLVGSSAARRLDGPSAHRSSGRSPGSEFAPKRAIRPQN